MARTPDRFPGEREEEALVLEDSGLDPSVIGEIRLKSGDFKAKDAVGVFNLRSGTGLTTSSHHVLDDLVHELAEDYYEAYTYDTGHVSNVTVWETAAKLKKIREEQYTYTLGQVSTLVEIQYDAAGVESQRMTYTLAYTGATLDSVTAVKTGAP